MAVFHGNLGRVNYVPTDFRTKTFFSGRRGTLTIMQQKMCHIERWSPLLHQWQWLSSSEMFRPHKLPPGGSTCIPPRQPKHAASPSACTKEPAGQAETLTFGCESCCKRRETRNRSVRRAAKAEPEQRSLHLAQDVSLSNCWFCLHSMDRLK